MINQRYRLEEDKSSIRGHIHNLDMVGRKVHIVKDENKEHGNAFKWDGKSS